MRIERSIIGCTTVLMIAGGVIAQDFVPSEIWSRMAMLRHSNDVFSAFIIGYEDKPYFVTAKHAVDGLSHGGALEAHHEGEWKRLDVQVVPSVNTNADIAVLDPGWTNSWPDSVECTTHGAVLSQDMFFLGYPFSMFTAATNIMSKMPLAFVKKGVCSSIRTEANGTRTIFLDAMNNPGFSGGPVVFYDRKAKKWKIAGVVSGYRLTLDRIVLTKNARALASLGNSGLLIAYDIDHAIQSLREYTALQQEAPADAGDRAAKP